MAKKKSRLRIRFGFPVGSLEKKTTELFEKIGIPVAFKNRVFKVDIKHPDQLITVFFMRPLKMPESIRLGTIDAGIFGLDCARNAGLEDSLEEITPLNYSKKTDDEVEVVLFAKRGFKFEDYKGRPIRVLTEFNNITVAALKDFYPDYDFEIRHIDQTVESYIIAGEADLGVTVTESGETLRKNKLKKIRRIMRSHTGLWARKSDMANPEFRSALEFLGNKLKGALRGEKNELLEFNIGKKEKETVLKFLKTNRGALDALPESESPTVSELADGGSAIKIIVLENKKYWLKRKLVDMGATRIIETPIKSIMY